MGPLGTSRARARMVRIRGSSTKAPMGPMSTTLTSDTAIHGVERPQTESAIAKLASPRSTTESTMRGEATMISQAGTHLLDPPGTA